jgi:MerR family transcriptional regulator/heat shock protein HspR
MHPSREDEPLYVISIAARLLECHPQTLRMYEREGLIEPRRTQRNVRLYSDRDIERARQIQRLTQDLGVNLAAVEVILDVLAKLDELRVENERLRREIERLKSGGPAWPQLGPGTRPPARVEIE